MDQQGELDGISDRAGRNFSPKIEATQGEIRLEGPTLGETTIWYTNPILLSFCPSSDLKCRFMRSNRAADLSEELLLNASSAIALCAHSTSMPLGPQ